MIRTVYTHLQLLVCPVYPLRVVGHAVCIRERLDTHLDLACVIEDTTVTIHVVLNNGKRVVRRRVAEDRVIPVLHVRVVLDEVGKCLPLVGGSN